MSIPCHHTIIVPSTTMQLLRLLIIKMAAAQRAKHLNNLGHKIIRQSWSYNPHRLDVYPFLIGYIILILDIKSATSTTTNKDDDDNAEMEDEEDGIAIISEEVKKKDEDVAAAKNNQQTRWR